MLRKIAMRLIALLLLLVLAPLSALAAPQALIGTGTTAFDTTGQKFGTASILGLQSTAANVFAGGTLTLEAWVKTTSATGPIVAAGQNNAAWIGFNANGIPHANYQSTASVQVDLLGTVAKNDGNWHHLELDASSAGAWFFVDGTLVATSATAAQATLLNGSNPFSVGGLGGVAANTWPGEVDEIAIWATIQHTASFTVQSLPYSGVEGMVHLWHVDSSGNDNAGYTTLYPNDPGLEYAGGADLVWHITPTTAQTINSGNPVRTTFSGTGAALVFNLAGNTAPLPQIYYSVDGQPPVILPISALMILTMPVRTALWARHTLEFGVKSTSETLSRWSPQTAGVTLSNIYLQTGGTLALPSIRSGKITLFLGDSITEGVRTLGQVSTADPTDVNWNDATKTWDWLQRELSGIEPINVGFGATGVMQSGSGGVPALGSSVDFLWSGQARNYSNVAAVVINHGTNDSGQAAGSFQAAYAAVLNHLLAVLPAGVPIVCMRPFNGSQWAPIQAAVAQINNTRVTTLDTTGFFDTTLSSDGLHPLGIADALIAPKLASLLRAKLAPAPIYFPWSHS